MKKLVLFIVPLFSLFGCNQSTPSCDHKWSNWESISETEHKRTCSLCNEFETKPHEFGEPINDGFDKVYTCSVCNYKKTEVISGVTVKGIAGMDGVIYSSLDDAYSKGKEILNNNGGLYGDSLEEEKFKALFTDYDENLNASITFTISGDITFNDINKNGLITLGRSNRDYGEGKNILNVIFKGVNDKAKLTFVNSTSSYTKNVALPNDNKGLKPFNLKFENLNLLDSTGYIRIDGGCNNCGYNIVVNNCVVNTGFDFLNTVEGSSYTYQNNIFELNPTTNPDVVYALKNCKTGFTGNANVTFKNNKVSGYKRGINIEYINGTAIVEDNDISITDRTRSAVQLSAISKGTVKNNKLDAQNGIDLRTIADIEISGNDFSKSTYVIHTNGIDEGINVSVNDENIYGEADKEYGWDKDANKKVYNNIIWPDEE